MLVSATTPLDPSVAGDLLGRLPPVTGVAWLREGEGFVGWGEAWRFDVAPGPDRFARASAALREAWDGAEVNNTLEGLWGTGLLAMGSFTFDPDAPGSTLVIPEVVVGVTDGRAWMTRTGVDDLPDPTLAHAHVPLDQGDLRNNADGPGPAPALNETSFLQAVAAATEAIATGGVEKVVLSLQVEVPAPPEHPFNRTTVLRRLAEAYPPCFTFAFDSFVGASPELLVRRQGTTVHSTPLAGSARRGATPEEDDRLGAALLASPKDRLEHDFAVVTVVEALHPLCRTLKIDREPSLLRLPNVQHLATQLVGELTPAAARYTALDLAGAVHPTAAVCGTPTRRALALIRRLEGASRGRYAGPVGWVGADGDGEWAIALRCAELDPERARLYAGGGIVQASDPEAELEEARLKLAAMQSALALGVT